MSRPIVITIKEHNAYFCLYAECELNHDYRVAGLNVALFSVAKYPVKNIHLILK